MNPFPMTYRDVYRTLKGEVFQISALAPEEREFYKRLKAHYASKPSQDDFNFYWQAEGKNVWGAKARLGEEVRRGIARSPIFRICQDLDARLAMREAELEESRACRKRQ